MANKADDNFDANPSMRSFEALISSNAQTLYFSWLTDTKPKFEVVLPCLLPSNQLLASLTPIFICLCDRCLVHRFARKDVSFACKHTYIDIVQIGW